MSDLLGYLRDFIAAGLGLAILFGADFTDDQIAGILLLVTTAGALISYAYQRWQVGNGTAAGE